MSDELAVNHPVEATLDGMQGAVDRACNEMDRLRAVNKALYAACAFAYAELDDRYDVDQPQGESAKEYPFSGAGMVMSALKAAMEKKR